jgi:hypothetical protein
MPIPCSLNLLHCRPLSFFLLLRSGDMDCNPIILELGISIEPNQKLHGQGGSGCEDRELGGELQRRVATWGVTYKSGRYFFTF